MNRPKKLEHKLLLQILSVFIAVIIWFVIVYTENPTRDVTISNIDIQYLGESQLFDRGFVLVDKAQMPGASVVVRGARSDLMDALKETTAVVDLREITEAGQYKLPVTYNLPSASLHITKRKTATVTVTIEGAREKEVPVKILQIGNARDERQIVESVPTVQSVMVSGIASDLENIAAALISVDITALTPDVEQKYTYVLVDAEDNPIDAVNEVSVEDEVVGVTNRVLLRKTVPVEVTFPRTLTEKHSVYIQSLSREEIDIGVATESAAPEKITVEYAGTLEEGRDTYTVDLVAPEGVYIPPESLQLEMKAEVKNKTIKSVMIPVQVENETGLAYEVTPENISVQARGPEDELNLDSLEAILDLQGLAKGEHELKVDVRSRDMDVDVLEEVRVKVRIY